MRESRLEGLRDVVGAGTAEDDNVEERVRAETVGTVDGNASSLTGGVQPGNDLVGTVLSTEGECVG